MLQFEWSRQWFPWRCCEGRAFSGWRSSRYGRFALCFESNFTFWVFKTRIIDSKCGTFGVNLILVAFETLDISFWHLWGEKFDILCKGDHPCFATCMYMRERAVSIVATIDLTNYGNQKDFVACCTYFIFWTFFSCVRVN